MLKKEDWKRIIKDEQQMGNWRDKIQLTNIVIILNWTFNAGLAVIYM